jgi:hypothetical protein
VTVAVPWPPFATMLYVSGLPSASVATSVPVPVVSSFVVSVPFWATGAALLLTPVPDTPTKRELKFVAGECAGSDALTDSVAEREPVALGVNVRENVKDAPTAMFVPAAGAPVTAKSAWLAPDLVIDRKVIVPNPLLVTVNVWAPEAMPTDWLPKLRPVGDAFRLGVVTWFELTGLALVHVVRLDRP